MGVGEREIDLAFYHPIFLAEIGKLGRDSGIKSKGELYIKLRVHKLPKMSAKVKCACQKYQTLTGYFFQF